MMTQEPTFPCPKCNQPFPMSQLHNHWNVCPGKPQNQNPFPQSYPQQQYQQAPAPMYIPPPPKHQHIWFENDTYKVCLDQTCKKIVIPLRGSIFLFLRYGLKIFWIELIVVLGLAFYVISLIHH